MMVVMSSRQLGIYDLHSSSEVCTAVEAALSAVH